MWGGFQYHRPRNVVLLASSTEQVPNTGPSGDIVSYANSTDVLARGEILEFQIVCTGIIAGTYSMTIYFFHVQFYFQWWQCACLEWYDSALCKFG